MPYPTTYSSLDEEAIAQAQEDEREREREQGIYPTITNEGLVEAQAMLRAAENKRLLTVEKKYEPFYTNPSAFDDEYGKDQNVREGQRWALDPKQVAPGVLNMEMLSAVAGRPLRGLEYDQVRDAWAKEHWGMEPEQVTEVAFAERMKGDFDSLKQANTAQRDLERQFIQEKMGAALEERPSDFNTIYNNWRATYQDVVPDKDTGRFYSNARKSGDELIGLMGENAELGGQIWQLMDNVRKGTATSEDVRGLGEQLAQLPIADQDRLNQFAAVAASELDDDQRAGLSQIIGNTARYVGESFGPMTGVGEQWSVKHDASLFQQLSGPSLQDRENALSKQIRDLEIGAPLPKKGVARPAYGMPELEAPPPPEQRASMIQAAKEELATLGAIRRLKSTINNKVDPIRPVYENTGMFSAGALERGLYGLAQSTGYMAAAAVPWVGTLNFVVMQGQQYERTMLENPEMDPQVATAISTLSAGPEALVEKWQFNTMAGLLPSTTRLFAGMQNKVGRYLANTAETLAAENLQEGLQDAINTFVPLVAANLRDDMPDKNVEEAIGAYFDERPVVFWSMLVPGLIGGGFATINDLKDPTSVLDPRMLSYAGLTPEEAQRVLASPDPTRTLQEIWPTRTQENITAGIAEFEGDLEKAAAAQNDPLRPTMETVTLADGTKEYRVLRSVPEEIEAEFLPDKDLEGKQVTLQFTNAVTGRTETQVMDAVQAQSRVQANLETYRQLIDCLGK